MVGDIYNIILGNVDGDNTIEGWHWQQFWMNRDSTLKKELKTIYSPCSPKIKKG